jgi:tellurite resistance protein
MIMQRPIDEHTALIFTMVLVSAAEGEMTDAELEMIGRQVRYLPVFRGFDHQRLTEVGRDCANLLRREDGLEVAAEMVAEALPQPLRETAYVIACDVAAADGSLDPAELEVLGLLRRRLNVDRLVAAAIERSAYARHVTL